MAKNLPEPGDIVVVTVKTVKKFGAEAVLEEYDYYVCLEQPRYLFIMINNVSG